MNIFSFLNYYYLGSLSWLNELYNTLPLILYTIIAVVGGAGAVYAIILGINLAKSESDDARKTAQNRIRFCLGGEAFCFSALLLEKERILPKCNVHIGCCNVAPTIDFLP